MFSDVRLLSSMLPYTFVLIKKKRVYITNNLVYTLLFRTRDTATVIIQTSSCGQFVNLEYFPSSVFGTLDPSTLDSLSTLSRLSNCVLFLRGDLPVLMIRFLL